MRYLVCLALIAPLAISPSILNAIGLGYVTGNPILGIHMSSYIAFAVAGLVLAIALNGRRLQSLTYPVAVLYMTGFCVLMTGLLVVTGETGFRLTVVLVTFLTPAILLFLVRNRGPGVFEFVSLFVTVFLVINSATGFYEYGTGNRLFPYITGLETITFDPRPTAILSHPLINAIVTGTYLLSLMIVAVRRGATAIRLAGILYFTASMFSFGGRAALVAVFVVFALYAVYQVATVLLSGGRESKSAVRTAFIVAGLAVALPIFLTTPIAAIMLDRFSNSRGSDETRTAALVMLDSLRGDELIFGLELATRTQLQASLGSNNGVELSWVSLVLYFGVPATVGLLVGMFGLIWSAAMRDRDQLFVGLFFVVTTFGSLSIGSRSLLLSQLMILMSFGPIASVRRRLSAPGGAGVRRPQTEANGRRTRAARPA